MAQKRKMSEGSKAKGDVTSYVQDPFAAMEMVNEGLPSETMDTLAAALEIPKMQLLDVLKIPRATAKRRTDKHERLRPNESDRAMRVMRVFDHASRVFGDRRLAASWLRRPAFNLRGHPPVELLGTDMGTREVERALDKISEGAPV